MACMGAIGLGVYEAHPAPNRSFPVYFQDGEVVYPQFACKSTPDCAASLRCTDSGVDPLRTNIVPIWAAALIAFFVYVEFVLRLLLNADWVM